MKCALHASVDMLIWKMAFYLSEKTVTILKKKRNQCQNTKPKNIRSYWSLWSGNDKTGN